MSIGKKLLHMDVEQEKRCKCTMAGCSPLISCHVCLVPYHILMDFGSCHIPCVLLPSPPSVWHLQRWVVHSVLQWRNHSGAEHATWRSLFILVSISNTVMFYRLPTSWFEDLPWDQATYSSEGGRQESSLPVLNWNRCLNRSVQRYPSGREPW